MKKNLGFLLIWAVVICIASCNHRHNTNLTEHKSSIQFTVSEKQNISSLIDSVLYIPLKESEQHIIPDVTKIRTTKGYIVIGSKKNAKLIVYNRDGEFQYEIHRRGHGNGEYLEVANFTVTDNNIYIIDNFQHSIHKYLLSDGTYICSDQIPFMAWDIEAFDDDSFLFTMIRNNKNAKFDIDHDIEYAVWETNGKWEVIKSYLPIPSDYVEMYGKQRFFNKINDVITFHTLKDNGYYRFEKFKNAQFIPFDFPNPLPTDFEGDLEDAIKNKYDYISETPFEVGRFVISTVTHNGLEEQYVYDSNQDEFFRNPSENAYNGLIEIAGILGSSPMGYITDFETYETLVNDGFARADSITEDVIRRGGASLILYMLNAVN